MADVLEQPVVDNSQQPDTSHSEQSSDVSISEIRERREGDTPRPESRKPYAPAEQPYERNKWRPDSESESKGGRGFQKRIDKLTQRNAHLERQLAQYQSVTSQQQSTQPQSTPAQPQDTPQGQQYESIEDMTSRVLREAAEREKTAGQPKEAQGTEPNQEQQRQQQEFQRAHVAKTQVFHQRLQAALKGDSEFAAIAKKGDSPLAPQFCRWLWWKARMAMTLRFTWRSARKSCSELRRCGR